MVCINKVMAAGMGSSRADADASLRGAPELDSAAAAREDAANVEQTAALPQQSQSDAASSSGAGAVSSSSPSGAGAVSSSSPSGAGGGASSLSTPAGAAKAPSEVS